MAPSAVLRLGFVPLIDAAPVIIAAELGLFAERGVHVRLERQIGWGNVRDKLTFGHLDAAHALLGIPVASSIEASESGGSRTAGGPIVGVMSLGTGGGAITLSRRLTDAGVTSAASLGRHLKLDRSGNLPLFGHVFGCSVHHYLLREWLSRGEINPDHQVRLTVVPPMLTVTHMADGYLDGFCVSDPWNTMAQRSRVGQVAVLLTDLLEAHPDKVLAVRRSLLETDPTIVTRLIEALLIACDFCADASNHTQLASLLSRREHLDIDHETIAASLSLDRSFNLRPSVQHFRKPGWHMRSFAPESTFPNVGHAVWLVEQMLRWGHIGPDVEPLTAAHASIITGPYREAAAQRSITCPSDDYRRLVGGSVSQSFVNNPSSTAPALGRRLVASMEST